MDFSWKNSWLMFFFLSEFSPFLELCPFKKIRIKSDTCHILQTMHAEVLKFHIWIPRGKVGDPYVFSCPSYLPFWSYAPLKKSEWNLVSKISQKVFELGLETWSADRGWWVDYLIKYKKNPFCFSGVMALWKFGYFKLVNKISPKLFELVA